jgi:prophage DNA circulation protein
LSGASPLLASTSAEVQDAFRNFEAAVANVEDLDFDWFAIVDLVDAASNDDLDACRKYRRQLREVAARVQAPLLVTYTCLCEGHALLIEQPVPDYRAAMVYYERAVAESRSAGDPNTEGISLRAVGMAATGLGRDDALSRCHDALAVLYENRLWQKIWQVLDSVVLALTRAERCAEAALILGHLQAHMPPCGMEEELRFRVTAAEQIHSAGDFSEALARGADMSPDEIVATALASCESSHH